MQLFLEIGKLLIVIGLGVFIANGTVDSNPDLFGTPKLLHIDDIVIANAVSTLAALIISFILLRKYLISATQGPMQPPAVLINTGFWSQTGQLVQFLNYRLNLVLLTFLLGSAAPAGVFSNALLIADTIWIFGNSFGTIAHMRILQSQNPAFRADLTIRYAIIAIAGTGLACLGMFLVPGSWYTGIFGQDFSELKDTAVLLIPAIMALGASTMFSHYLHAVNRFQALLLANAMGLAVQAGLAFLLIPKYKLYGACAAADAGFIVILIIVFALFKTQNPTASFKGAFRLTAIRKVLLRWS